jgi:3-deoxy-D-manno-octulosonic acid (KDO) 8-phosphate synthase
MYTLTQALKGVFVDAHMTDQSNNQSGPSFTELTRMEEFWEVEKNPTKNLKNTFSRLYSI